MTTSRTLTDLLFERAGVGLCLVAPDGTILRANEEWLRSTGYRLDEVVGAEIIELFPGTRDMALALHARARAGHHVDVPRHAQVVHGDETWWEGSIDPVPMEGGTGLLISAHQVTPEGGALHRDLAEDSETSDLVTAVLDSVANLVVVLDGKGRIVRFNSGCERVTGYTAAEVLGKSVIDLFVPPDERASLNAVFERLLAGDYPSRHQNRWRTKDGSERLLEWANTCVVGERGDVKYVVATATDVTAREASRQALARREAELRLAQRISHIGSWSWTVGTERIDASEEVLRIYGHDPEEPIPANDSEELRRHYTPEGWASRDAAFRRALVDGLPWEREEQILRTDGSVRWVHFRGEAERDESGRIVKLRGTVQDITERKRVEDALRETEQRFRALTDAMPQIVCALTPDGTPEYVNTSWVVYSGLDLEATRRAGWRGVLHPDDFPAAQACVRTALERRAPQDVELRYRAADGAYRWFLSRLAPILERDRVVRFLGAGMDIHDRRCAEAERERLLAHVQDADRRKDEFLAVLSHELRNPLAPIRNSTYVLRHVEAGSDQARRAREIIERQTEHLTRLVDDLLDVTRIARGKIGLRRARVDLRELVRRAADDYHETMRERGIAFRTVLPEVETYADADATRIAQVVGNLLHNAAKFTRRGDEVTVALRVDEGEAEISVRDTGAGIDAALLPYVFDAFVQSERTLARTEGGLGLGLALVKGITELHGGTVHVESAGHGRGAEFVVRLPLLVPWAGGRDRERLPVTRTGRTRRVLVVDDNRDAAESLAQIVEMLGHVAEVVHDGATAVERARTVRPDVILCDIGLPGMTGYEVAQEIRAERGDGLQLIAVTGYAQPDDVAKALEAGFDGHLAKPCDPDMIARLLA